MTPRIKLEIAFLNLTLTIREHPWLFDYTRPVLSVFEIDSQTQEICTENVLKGVEGLLIADRFCRPETEKCKLCGCPTHYSKYYMRQEGGLFVADYFHCCIEDGGSVRDFHYLISRRPSRVLEIPICDDFVRRAVHQIKGYLEDQPEVRSREFLESLKGVDVHFSQHAVMSS